MNAKANPTVPLVYSAISAVMADVAKEGISKDRRNQAQGYNFRGIDDVYNVLAPVLARHKLIITPRGRGRTCEERVSAKGGTLFYVNVEVEYELASAEDGSSLIAGPFYGEAMDSGDKATNKAQSAAFKYMAMQQFCIPTEGDNDADAATHEVAPSAQAPKAIMTAAKAAIDVAETMAELDAWKVNNGQFLAGLERTDLAAYNGMVAHWKGRAKIIKARTPPSAKAAFPGSFDDVTDEAAAHLNGRAAA